MRTRPPATHVTTAVPPVVMAAATWLAPRVLPGMRMGAYQGPPGVRSVVTTPVGVAHAAMARPSSLPATDGAPVPRACGAMTDCGSHCVAPRAPEGSAASARRASAGRFTHPSCP